MTESLCRFLIANHNKRSPPQEGSNAEDRNFHLRLCSGIHRQNMAELWISVQDPMENMLSDMPDFGNEDADDTLDCSDVEEGPACPQIHSNIFEGTRRDTKTIFECHWVLILRCLRWWRNWSPPLCSLAGEAFELFIQLHLFKMALIIFNLLSTLGGIGWVLGFEFFPPSTMACFGSRSET